MKNLLGFLSIMGFVYLTVFSYEYYTHRLFQMDIENSYGKNHYRLKQMSSENLLCVDSKNHLCWCGRCQ